MRKILFLLTIVLLAAVSSYSQAPGIFNYQGVARNSVGNVLANKSITLRLTIHDGTAAGPTVYQESRGVITNPFGLFNVQVGSPGGTNVTGNIPGVSWGVGAKYIQVEIDPNGGTTFINIGTAQLASVPYALFANSAADLILPFNKTQADAGTLFKITNSGTGSGSTALEGLTNSTAGNVSAVIGTVTSVAPGAFSAGVRGINNGTGGNGIGVYGSQNGSGYGVYGTAPSGWAIRGESTSGVGSFGSSTSGTGVFGTSTSGAGVFGLSNTGNAGLFTNTNAANTATTVDVSNNGTNNAINSVNTGTGRAGFFQVNNAASTADALRAETNGIGASWAIRGVSTGTNGAGLFLQTNPTNTSNNLQSNQAGLGRAGLFNSTNAANTAATVLVQTNATTGVGLQVNQTGTGQVTAVYGNISTTTNASAGVAGTDFSSGGASPIDARTFGILGQTGTTGIAVGGYALNGGTALRGSGGGATGYALNTTGRVQLAGINEGLNRVLASDAVGNATWQNLGAIGGVTGSGTVNFVPKWTPVGTNLGNSQIFDNGTNVGVNNAAPSYRLDVTNTGGSGIRSKSSGGFSIIDIDAANGDEALRFMNNGVFDWHIGGGLYGGLNFLDMKAGQNRMLIQNGTGNVGINQASPTYKLDVDATGATGIKVSNTSSFATVDIFGVATDQALRFGKNGALYSGINTLPGGDHINFFKFGGGDKMSLNVVTGNFGVGGVPTNAVAKVDVKGFTVANNLYTSSTGFTGATGLGVKDAVAQASNEKWGIYGFANGSALTNYGVFGEPGTTGSFNTGIFGRVSSAPTGGISYGVTGFDPVNIAGTTWAAGFFGKVQILDGTQGAGKIFTSDAAGTGSWNTAAGAGLVSGSGTLNFIPKWTPDGVTLGNSIMFDNGASVNVGTTTSDNAIMLLSAPVNPALRIKNSTSAAVLGGVYLGPFANQDIYLGTNENSAIRLYTTGTEKMRVTNTGNVGIGNINPLNKFDVVNANNTNAGNFGNTNVANNVGTVRAINTSSAVGAWGVHAISLTGTGYPGNATPAAVVAETSSSLGIVTSSTGAFALRAGALTTDAIYAETYSVTGNTAVRGAGLFANSYGVVGTAGSGTGAGGFFTGGTTALRTLGGVQLTGIGEANGKVLTSDASGNASWQATPAKVAFKASGLSSAVSVPFFTYVPISQWNSVDYEIGSVGNYNGGTGEYTAPVTGTYHVDAEIVFNQPGASGSGYAGISIFVNGFAVNDGLNTMLSLSLFNGIRVSGDISVNASDKVQIQVFHRTSGTVSTFSAPNTINQFSIHLIK